MSIEDILDLDKYPLHRPGTAPWQALVDQCKADLATSGMFNLEGLVRADALEKCVAEVKPVMDTLSFVHTREHNIYFLKSIPGLADDHPALTKTKTINHTVCADQIPQSIVMYIYEWAPMVVFLTAVMEKPALYLMRDPLARANVMAYREGEQLNWHFDRSEFTTTLLLQAPEEGGDFVYRSDLRTADDPNYDGVAKLLRGEDPDVKALRLKAGTLNVFKGRNTAHKVSTVRGSRERMIAVFSYYEKPGVMFSRDEQIGFYGRTG
jgi:hypothetical protein